MTHRLHAAIAAFVLMLLLAGYVAVLAYTDSKNAVAEELAQDQESCSRYTAELLLRRQRVLPPEQIRALARGSALVLATGCRPAMVTLQPWYSGPRAEHVNRHLSQVASTIGSETVRSGR